MASSIWYWCADQVIVQRTLSAKNISHAKAGCVLASLLKFLPLFLLVFPGMAARVLFTNEVSIAQGGFDGRRQRSCKCNYVDFYKETRPHADF